MSRRSQKSRIICLCNGISEQTIIEAIQKGAANCDQVYDATGAGVGPCGGTCRSKTKELIEKFKKQKKD